MSSSSAIPDGRVVSFIDIGTNSIRLLVVRFNPNRSYTVLSRQKQQVRLGEGEFENESILPEAMDRAVMVCRKFSDLARTFNTEEFVAVATSAAREASNQLEFITNIRREAQLDVRVISGREEARLIYLGVSNGFHLGGKTAAFIDIGGGSTEIAVGDEKQYLFLDSLKIGAIRLSNEYFDRMDTGPVSAERYKKILQHVKNETVHVMQKMRRQKIDCIIASSGTAMNLAEIASRTFHDSPLNPDGKVSFRDLKKVGELLCSLPLDQRRKVPGINPERADIIIAGAAILESLVKELGLSVISTTSRGLQDGLLIDYVTRMDDFPLFSELSVRERSVLQLGRSCGINESHSRVVTNLALELFDSARVQKLHSYKEKERELLEYAGFLHDIGSFISYTNHHAHSYYIISNAELLGFDQKEIAIIANIARFHRKRPPRKSILEILDFEPRDRETVLILSTFLRLAESLDRSHAALVKHVRLRHGEKGTVRLEISTRGDCQLEIWGVEAEKKAFEKIFGKELILDVTSPVE